MKTILSIFQTLWRWIINLFSRQASGINPDQQQPRGFRRPDAKFHNWQIERLANTKAWRQTRAYLKLFHYFPPYWLWPRGLLNGSKTFELCYSDMLGLVNNNSRLKADIAVLVKQYNEYYKELKKWLCVSDEEIVPEYSL